MSTHYSKIESLKRDAEEIIKRKKAFTQEQLLEYAKIADYFFLGKIIRYVGKSRDKSYFLVLEKLATIEHFEVKAALANAIGNLQDLRGVSLLIRLAKEDQYLVRWEALIALSNFKTKNALPIFIKNLKNEFQFIRIIAARALAEIPDLQSLDALHACFHDASLDLKIAVIDALSRIGSHLSLSHFEKALEYNDNAIKFAALTGLIKFSDKKYLPQLAKLAHSGDANIRLLCVQILEKYAYEECLPILEHYCYDAHVNVRVNAIKAIGQIGAYRQLEKLYQLSKDKHPLVRAEAAIALGKLGYRESLNRLLSMIKDTNKAVRSAAAIGISQIDEEYYLQRNIESQLIDISLNDYNKGDIFTRRNALQNLSNYKLPQSLDLFKKANLEHDIQIRKFAIKGFGKIASKKSYQSISKCFSDTHAEVRWEALKTIDNPKSMQFVKFYKQLLNDPLPSIRLRASLNLLFDSEQNHIQTLTKQINEADVWVRWSIVYALVQYDSPQIIPALKQVLKDPFFEIRYLAAIKLGKMQIVDAIDVLLQFMDTDDLHIQTEISFILAEIKSHKEGLKIAQLLSNPNSAIQNNIIEALEQIPSKSINSVLLPYYADASPAHKIKILDKMRREQPVQVDLKILDMAMNDHNEAIIKKALWVIAKHNLDGFINQITRIHQTNKNFKMLTLLYLIGQSDDKQYEKHIKEYRNFLFNDPDLTQVEIGIKFLKDMQFYQKEALLFSLLHHRSKLIKKAAFDVLKDLKTNSIVLFFHKYILGSIWHKKLHNS